MIRHGMCCVAKLAFLDGVHAPMDTYKIALYTSDALLDCYEVASYTDSCEVSGFGYEPGGLILRGRQSALIDGKGCLTFDQPIWPKGSFTARAGLIYNASKGNAALGVIDFEKNFTVQNGPFVVEMPSLDPERSLIVIE